MNRSFVRFLTIGAFLSFMVLGGAAGVAQDLPHGKVEIFAGWRQGQGPALEALIKLFKVRHPDIKVVNSATTNGLGADAQAVLKTRMQGGNPPDSFQVRAVQGLIDTWVTADRMEDLSGLYQSQGWMTVFPKDLIKRLGTDRGIWSVPLGIHRSNLLWYVPAHLKRWGVTPPGSWSAFFKLAPKLKARGIVPLSLGANWTASHLWESVALAVLGPDKWEALWQGALPWTSDEVIAVWQVFAGIMEYTNADAASLSWQQAVDMMVDGQAAFNIMGDWAADYLRVNRQLEPGKDFGWSASPGTNGAFMFLADVFGLAAGSPNRNAAVAWLTVLGSRAGSDAYNPLNGSISARLDSDLARYNAYAKTAARDFRRDRIVGSLAHGVVADEKTMDGFSVVMETFLEKRYPRKAAVAMKAIAIQNGIAP